jgi:hypothetical protein
MSSSHTRLVAASYNPVRWPIIEPDLVLAFIHDVLVVRLGPEYSEATQRRHFAEVATALDAAPDGFRYAVLVHIEKSFTLDAARRRDLAEFIQARLQDRTKTCVAEVLVTRAPATLAIAHVLGWLAPRSVPFITAQTLETGFRNIAERLPGVDVGSCVQSYTKLVRLQTFPGAVHR